MRIKEIALNNFKRFTDLSITGIPESARLVLLVGTNGSGKSSLFDAFELVNTRTKSEDVDATEYAKTDGDILVKLETYSGKKIQIGSNGDGVHAPTMFYGRTSFRMIPELTRTNQSNVPEVKYEVDSDRPRRFIERDQRFENDIDRISGQILREIFSKKSSTDEIQNLYIRPVNEALGRIFGAESPTALELIEIIPPLEGKVAELNFKKGVSTIHYNYLSAGEKEVVNILFNLLVRRAQYTDTIYFFDEIDLHLNTALQHNLLKEITENWIPAHCQLWTASHSLGFMDYANEYEHGVIIDFDNLDFDKAQVIEPTVKNNYDVFELAVSKEMLGKLFLDKKIVFAENTDTALYNDLSLPNTIFFTSTDKLGVFHQSKNMNALGLIDRDYLSDAEVKLVTQTYPHLRILPYYSIENLLYHPDNLEEYYTGMGKVFDQDGYVAALTVEKNARLADMIFGMQLARSGYPFFKENEHAVLLRKFKSDKGAMEQLESAEFETYYKVFPAKDYGKTIPARLNLSRKDLAKTSWFRNQIEKAIND